MLNVKNIVARRTVRAAALALAAVAALGGTAAAHASAGGGGSYAYGGYTVLLDDQAHYITASYDGMNVAIPSASQLIGTRAIQWYVNGGAEQKWFYDQVYGSDGGFEGILLRNDNSGQCLSTDGWAGDTVFQESCDPTNSAQWFWRYGTDGASNEFQNRYTGYYLDVSGFSYGAGANIDLWYSNGGGNQVFWSTKVGS